MGANFLVRFKKDKPMIPEEVYQLRSLAKRHRKTADILGFAPELRFETE